MSPQVQDWGSPSRTLSEEQRENVDRNKTKKGEEGDTGGDHSIIKRGARESMSVESETEGNNRGKREISPGISKMRTIFEAEQTEVRGEEVKQVSNVNKLKNSFENMMGNLIKIYA